MGAHIDVEGFIQRLEQMRNLSPIGRAVGRACGIVQKDIMESMRDTPTREEGVITHNSRIPHHPSLPNNPPAVDTGTLKDSITFSVEEGEGKIVGRVGSIWKQPPYGFYLEFGTSRMIQRPWLRPAMKRNWEVVKETIKEAVEEVINGRR